MKLLFKTIAWALMIILIGYAARYVLVNSGALSDIDVVPNQGCLPIPIAPGPEDLTIDSETGVVYISAYNRREKGDRNGIYAFHVDAPQRVRLVSVDAPKDFQPHGISLFSGKSHKQLYAVSHRKNGDEVVEIFQVAESGDLLHQKTVQFDAMHSPNDIQAIGEGAFYITNDRGAKGSMVSRVMSYLGLNASSVAFYDGTEGRIVADSLSYANGINISADHRSIYVAESLPRNLRVYSRDVHSNNLDYLKDIPLNSAPDNIEVDSHGRLWIAGHSNIFEFIAFKNDPASRAPSHVSLVDVETGTLTDIYYDDGQTYRASTSASTHGNHFYVGSLYEDHILMCPLPVLR